VLSWCAFGEVMVVAASPFRRLLRAGRVGSPRGSGAAARRGGCREMHRRPTWGGGSTRLGPRRRRAFGDLVAREPRRRDCCRALRGRVVLRAFRSPRNRAPKPRWGASLRADYAGGLPDRPCVCSRSARGAPRRLSAGAAIHPRGAPELPPQKSRRGVPHGSTRRARSHRPPRAPRSRPKAHHTTHTRLRRAGAPAYRPFSGARRSCACRSAWY